MEMKMKVGRNGERMVGQRGFDKKELKLPVGLARGSHFLNLTKQ